MNNTVVVFLTQSGYKLSSMYGKILFKGRAFGKLEEACNFCKNTELDYVVA